MNRSARWRSRRLQWAAVVVVAAVVGVVGWRVTREPADPFADYCTAVVEQRPIIATALDAGPTTGLIRALPAFQVLQAEAPEDIADDWKQVTEGIQHLVDVLDAAGVDPATYDRKATPTDLTRSQRQEIDAAAAALGASATSDALASVEQQARDVCGSPLSL